MSEPKVEAPEYQNLSGVDRAKYFKELQQKRLDEQEERRKQKESVYKYRDRAAERRRGNLHEDGDDVAMYDDDYAILSSHAQPSTTQPQPPVSALAPAVFDVSKLRVHSNFARAVLRSGIELPLYARGGDCDDLAYRQKVYTDSLASGQVGLTVEVSPYAHLRGSYGGVDAMFGVRTSRDDNAGEVMVRVPVGVLSDVKRALRDRGARSSLRPNTSPSNSSNSKNSTDRNNGMQNTTAHATAVIDDDDIFGDVGDYVPAHVTAKNDSKDSFDESDNPILNPRLNPNAHQVRDALRTSGKEGEKEEEDTAENRIKRKQNSEKYSFLTAQEDEYAEMFPSYYSSDNVNIKNLLELETVEKNTKPDARLEKQKFDRELKQIGEKLNLKIDKRSNDNLDDDRHAKRARILGQK